MAKLFYTQEEVQEKLGRGPEEIKQLVAEGLLREFRDGAKKMFKVDEVDNLAQQGIGSAGDTSGISLTPEDTASSSTSGYDLASSGAGQEEPPDLSLSGTGPAISPSDTSDEIDLAPMESASGTELSGEYDLEDTTEQPSPVQKKPDETDDTMMASFGVNVLEDSGEEQTPTVDDMGQTQVAPDLEDLDSVTLDSGSSGSGLLDLSREADDTSLGAELLDEIYPGKEEHAIETQVPDGFEMPAAPTASMTGEAPPPMADYAAIVEVEDPAANVYGVMLLMPLVALVALAIAAVAGADGTSPGLFDSIADYHWYVFGGLGALALLVVIIGSLMVGGAPTKSKKARKPKKAGKKKKKGDQEEEVPAE